jgi:hypoxanthine phosphoribosyltransferase
MNVNELLDRSKILYDYVDLEVIIEDMAEKIHCDLHDSNPIILCVMNGGMMFTAKLMENLKFPMQFDFCQVSRYGKNEKGGMLHWKRKPEIDMAGRTVLICDDIFDEGITLDAIKTHCENKGAIVKTAVLFDKIRGEKLPLQVDYVGAEIQDLFIFGFGLDYMDYCRNLNEVRYKI